MSVEPGWSRRQFVKGCSAAVAAMAGSRVASLSFADVPAPAALGAGRDMLVVVFLRGGMDGLNFIAPVDDRNYLGARPAPLRLAASGDNAGLRLGNAPANADFRIHPSAKALKELYDGKHLAVIHACGLTNGTRSHFEAQDLMERGVADMKLQALSTGWLTRHLAEVKSIGLLPGISAAGGLPNSLLGCSQGVAVPTPQSFSFAGDPKQFDLLAKVYAGPNPIQRAGAATVKAVRLIQGKLKRSEQGEVLPYAAEKGIEYPNGELSDSLKTVAQLIKMDVGLEVAAVDYGGWDTHQDQPGSFPGLIEQLSNALGSFYNDVSAYHNRLSLVVMSEFGRRLNSNESSGTDHGHGNVMLALGGNVNGGKIFGLWPGLETEKLDDRADLAVTTDYRTILAELTATRLKNSKLSAVFPELKTYKPLGIFRGEGMKTDLPA